MSRKMKILIAYDGSECARDALGDLTRAGLPEEAEAIVISVADAYLPHPSEDETDTLHILVCRAYREPLAFQ